MYNTPIFTADFKTLTPEVIDLVPKVLLHTTGELKEVLARVEGEPVVYIEHIVSGRVDEAVAAAQEAKTTVGLVVDLDASPDAVDDLGKPFVVGGCTVDAALAARLREQLVPVMLRGPIAEQVRVGTPYITQATALFDDFQLTDDLVPGPLSAWVRDRGIPVLCDPRADVAEGAIEALADHPIELLDKLGFRVAVAGFDAALITDLAESLEIGLDEVFAWTVSTLQSSLLPAPLRARLEQEVVWPMFAQFTDENPQAGQQETPDATDAQEVQELGEIDPLLLAELGIDPEDLQPRA